MKPAAFVFNDGLNVNRPARAPDAMLPATTGATAAREIGQPYGQGMPAYSSEMPYNAKPFAGWTFFKRPQHLVAAQRDVEAIRPCKWYWMRANLVPATSAPHLGSKNNTSATTVLVSGVE